jgi:uncharacterized protein YjbI with pentapeptide repeats
MNWRFDPIIIGAAVGLAAAVLFGAGWLWWRLPKREADRLKLVVRDAKARADLEDNFRKTIGQALAGIFVLLGAGLAYYGTLRTIQANNDQARLSQQAAHDLLISNQVAKGFEQFGNANVRVRLGGIYALEGVMNTSEQYHRPVLEALCAFVRDGTRTETSDGPPATDIQAALTVIGRRAVMGPVSPDLVNAHIQKADLSNAHLTRANLSEADLSHANVSGADLSDANLSGANLSGSNLSNEYLVRARKGVGGFIAIGPVTKLTNAILLATNLADADLAHADLSGAILRGANLSGAILVASNLSKASLSNANLEGALMRGADLSDADLSNATLNGANLSAAGVSQAQLDKACGTGAKLDPGLTLKQCPPPAPGK